MKDYYLIELLKKSVSQKGDYIFKEDFPIVLEELEYSRGKSGYHDDEAESVGLTPKEFYELVTGLDKQRMLRMVREEIEREHPDTGMIIGIEPELYVIDGKKVRRFYQKAMKGGTKAKGLRASDLLEEVRNIKGSWDDGYHDDEPPSEEEEYLSPEEEFYEYLMDADWDFESPFFEKKKVSYEQGVKLGLQAIKIWKQAHKAAERVARIDEKMDEVQARADEYMRKGQYGRYAKSEAYLNKLDKEYTKAENAYGKILDKYGLSGEHLAGTLEDFAEELLLSDRAASLGWGVYLQWDLRAGEWDTDVDPGDFVDSPI